MPENTPDETPIDLAPIMQQQELDQLAEANKAGFAELASMNAQADPSGLIHLRIEILAEMMFGDGPGMLQFKLRFERKVAEVLQELLPQVRKARLAAPPQQFSPQSLQQMAKAKGLFDGNGNPVRR